MGNAVLILTIMAGLSGSELSHGNCVRLDGPVITAADLSRKIAAFGGLPGERRFGFAPEPGMTRVISATELNRHLASANVNGSERTAVEQGICVFRVARRVTREEVIAAIHRAFLDREIHIEVLDISKQRVASSGEVRFSNLELPNTGSALMAVTWNGWFVEPQGRKQPIWARVRLKEFTKAVVARRDIAAGEQLTEENTGEEQRESFPWIRRTPPSQAAVLGMTARNAILAGEPVLTERLVQTPVIHKGDTVVLETITPNTRLTVEGRAESTAYRGQRVSITTVLSKKVIQAVAEETGRAKVSIDRPPASAHSAASAKRGRP